MHSPSKWVAFIQGTPEHLVGIQLWPANTPPIEAYKNSSHGNDASLPPMGMPRCANPRHSGTQIQVCTSRRACSEANTSGQTRKALPIVLKHLSTQITHFQTSVPGHTGGYPQLGPPFPGSIGACVPISPLRETWSDRTPYDAGSPRCSCCLCASESLPGCSTSHPCLTARPSRNSELSGPCNTAVQGCAMIRSERLRPGHSQLHRAVCPEPGGGGPSNWAQTARPLGIGQCGAPAFSRRPPIVQSSPPQPGARC